MKLLVLGGTRFLGRHVVQAALDAGHAVTLAHRGRTNPGLFAPAERLTIDRDGDLSALRGQRCDAVIDCCGYRPEQLTRTAEALAESGAPHYVFVSSVSAHAAFAPGRRYDEDAPLHTGTQGYGQEKARAEEAIQAAWPAARVTIVRPGLIVGPFDPTGRFTYWPARIARGGDVLAPGRPERPVQWIDGRDLGAWCVALAAERRGGVFNAVGPQVPMAELLDACVQASGSRARLTWIDDATLVAADAPAWTGLPLWVPDDDAEAGGIFLGDNTRAVAAGLRCRPTIDTVRDTLDWLRRDAQAVTACADALSPEREAALIAAARDRQ
jgi:2'-hydroxyisoflavone reductase